MRAGRFAAATAVLVLALVGAGALGGCERGVVDGPVAAVLDPTGRVLLVDLEKQDVIRTTRLRSKAWDIDADDERGTFVTAQGGGVSTDADDKVGVIDARTGRVRYVTLPAPNPLGVEVTAPGRVLVDHGFQDARGAYAFVVDTDAMEVVREGRIPDNNEPVEVFDGVGWSMGVDLATGSSTIRRVDPVTLACAEPLRTGGYAAIRAAGGTGRFGWLDTEQGPAVARFDPESVSVESSVAVSVLDGRGDLVVVGDRVIAADFGAGDPGTVGSALYVIDARSMRVERTVRVEGGVCDLDVWDGRVVAAAYLQGALLVIDPATGRVESRIVLPNMPRVPWRVAVMERLPAP